MLSSHQRCEGCRSRNLPHVDDCNVVVDDSAKEVLIVAPVEFANGRLLFIERVSRLAAARSHAHHAIV